MLRLALANIVKCNGTRHLMLGSVESGGLKEIGRQNFSGLVSRCPGQQQLFRAYFTRQSGLFSNRTASVKQSMGFSTIAPSDWVKAAGNLPLLQTFALALGINWAGWLVSRALKTEKYYDLFGTSTFLAVASYALFFSPAITQRKILAYSVVAAWALRLGSYLVYRVHKTGKDSRFDDIKNNEGLFFFMWTIQAVWAWTTLLPVMFIMNRASSMTALVATDFVGLGVAIGGLLTESVADWQKFAFKQELDNAGKFISTGLWSLSRYPNYFGEMSMWWGMYILCAADMRPWQLGVGLLSPIFVMVLLLKMSGIPIQERQAQERWGEQFDYQEYVKKTNLLIPLPVKVSLWKDCSL